MVKRTMLQKGLVTIDSRSKCINRDWSCQLAKHLEFFFQVRKITLPVFEPEFDPLGFRKRKLEQGEDDIAQESNKKDEVKDAKFVTGVPLTNMAGHTGYLTFATLPPR